MDIIDMKILSKILNNCRESDRQIGKDIGISGGAVRARIRKMENSGVIEKFAVKIEPQVLGYSVLYVVVSGHNIDEIIEQMSLIGQPFFIIPCVGGITVCSIVVKDDLEQKIELTKNVMKDVRILSIFEAENTGFNPNLTKTDLEIIEQLISDPRKKIDTLARITGLSTKTITRCIDKLQKNEGIQFTLIYDPKKIQGFIPHAILTWINGNLNKILRNMEEKFSESYLQIPFTVKNQIVLFMYSRDIFEMDDLTQKVREMSDVKSIDLFIPKKVSFPTQWLTIAIDNAKKLPKLHLRYQIN